jgi:glycosyltransferase involved in cell wall biosynthesis
MSEELKIRQKGVSIVVCCYNSTNRLQATLDHILNQQTSDGLQWEIIVVNNNSTDNTKNNANDILANAPQQIPFKVVDEPEPGLSSARKKGYDSSNYEYLLLVDDDNWLSPSYIQTVFNLFENHTDVGIIGGWGSPEHEINPPEWFSEFSSCYALGEQAKVEEGKSWGDSICVYGAGMGLRMSALEMLQDSGYYALLSDRKGDTLISGGDTELCYAMRLGPYRVIYDHRLQFKHLMPKGRINWKYLKKLTFGFGRASVVMQVYDHYLLGAPKPNSNGMIPLWINRTLYLLSQFRPYIKFLVPVTFKTKQDRGEYLAFIGWKGRLSEMVNLNSRYIEIHDQISSLSTNLKNV